jgi:polyphosphate kinase
VAPGSLRRHLLARIEREIERHTEQGGGGHLAFKMNALVDRRCIRALYEASRSGVRVDLQVRGICCLRPGVPGVSENITVSSVVGRFLEHARIYYFRNGGDEEILAGSADLMPRNLDGRVEVLFPIRDPRQRDAIRDGVLFMEQGDNVRTRRLSSNGIWERLEPAAGEAPRDSQAHWVQRRGSWHGDD